MDRIKCIQCTSPLGDPQDIRKNSCLNGTLTPLPCGNRTSESSVSFKQCVSAVFNFGEGPTQGKTLKKITYTEQVKLIAFL